MGCFWWSSALSYLPLELFDPRRVAKIIFFPTMVPQMWQQPMMVFADNDPKLMHHIFRVEELLKTQGVKG